MNNGVGFLELGLGEGGVRVGCYLPAGGYGALGGTLHHTPHLLQVVVAVTAAQAVAVDRGHAGRRRQVRSTSGVCVKHINKYLI